MFGRVEDTSDEGSSDEGGDGDELREDGRATGPAGAAAEAVPSAFESLHKRTPAAGAADVDEAALSEQGIETFVSKRGKRCYRMVACP